MEIELSVIIPVYNVAAYLPQCLDSVAGQLGAWREGPVEVLLIDDGSTDGSGRIADRYAEKCPRIQVIHKINAGVAAARNTGMRRAKGKWLYFMDADDWLADNGLVLLHEMMQRHREADLILFDAYRNTGGKEQTWEHFPQNALWVGREQLYKLQRGVLYYPMDFPAACVPLAAPWDKLYRRAFLLHWRIWFREELHVLDDMIFNMEVLGRAAGVAYEKNKVYHYRHVDASITNKYQADRIAQDKKVWDYIEWYQTRQVAEAVWEADETVAFCQAYYCRIIRSFAICCRIHFYHKENKKGFGKKQRYVREVARSSPYAEAFGKVKLRSLEWRLKALVILVRCRLYGGVYLLHLSENILARRLGTVRLFRNRSL